MINYETFESSSEDEFSQGAFESACASLVNKEKNPKVDISDQIEQKRIERQRRKERKANEKVKNKMEQDRQKRKNIRKKFRLQSLGIDQFDEYHDDMLNFKDSERESVISYFEDPDQIILDNFVDTPTRLVNHSNEFLGQVKKINQEKLSKKKQELNNIRKFQ